MLCPAPGPATAAFRWLAELLVEVFEARVVPMSATEHDSAAALASHVPHLLAGALAGAVQRAPLRDAMLALAAGSFSDGTRVAGTPADRTANMLLGNRDRVLRELAEVTAFLDELAAALRAEDAPALTARYDEARASRVALRDRRFDAYDRQFPAGGDHAARGVLVVRAGGGRRLPDRPARRRGHCLLRGAGAPSLTRLRGMAVDGPVVQVRGEAYREVPPSWPGSRSPRRPVTGTGRRR